MFSFPAALWLPGASTNVSPNDEAPIWTDAPEIVKGKWSTRREVAAAWKCLGGMLNPREIKKLRNTFIYLAAWFLLSDGNALTFLTYNLTDKTHSRVRYN